MNCKVYSAYGKKLVFEGTDGECWKWIISQAEAKLSDGTIIYREWTENGDRFIDVGNVYIFNS